MRPVWEGTKTDMKQVTMYCDGSCTKNPGGDGGWAVKLFYKNSWKELSDGPISETTNQRMELMALIRGLESLSERCEVHVYTDSKYLRNGVHDWLAKWEAKGWRNSQGNPVANQDLWRAIANFIGYHQLMVHWIRGHNGNEHNERVDQLAKTASGKIMI